ncbi:MAG: hypothetical protein LBS62_07420 [Clostridiales bacterium]|jgi:hypothetical protein|nr:hypothetical protein [Clostridiales bacterium]
MGILYEEEKKEEAGGIAQAAAMSLLILVINVLVRLLYETVVRIIKNHMESG